MSGFKPLLQKELLEHWRTFRLPVVAMIFLMLGLMSPLLAKYLPQLVEQFAGELDFVVPPPVKADAIDQTLKNIGQFGPIAAILLAMGTVAGEKQRGTAGLVLTKPVTRTAFLVAKFAALSITLAIAMVLGCAGSYLYTYLLFGAVPVVGFFVFSLMLTLSVLVYAALTFLGSTVLRSALPAAAGLAVFAGTAALGAVPGIGDVMPSGLYPAARAAALGLPGESVPAPVAANVAVIVLALAFSWLSFRRQAL